ncbi:AI-2E family transporter [Enterobacter cloacae subsp. cloacae]|nr:AI-2E family transporter [Enterobacter cloacae subsp. cloacae]
MIVVGVAAWIGFLIFGLNYSLLLAVLRWAVGPYSVYWRFVVTIPVVGVALFQFWLGTEFWNLLRGVPDYSRPRIATCWCQCCSQTVNLHPLVIILSVVIFGGLWGFWGVFFAHSAGDAD